VVAGAIFATGELLTKTKQKHGVKRTCLIQLIRPRLEQSKTVRILKDRITIEKNYIVPFETKE
jgi:hypothetical protein